ncbi:MAG: nucleotidyltransferase [Deltaproteobacteria bacterium]|nr:nucleotidyltransferase [Deltaproteobacteria bacterium]
MTAALEHALTDAVEVFDQAEIRYAIVGGLAVGAWGVSRSTRDVDFYAELPSGRRPGLAKALVEKGFDVPAMEEELRRFGVFRSRSSEGVFVDIFDAVGPLGEELLAHRREVAVFGRTLWVTAPEELFLLKAFSDRERDFEDLVSLASLPRLRIDFDYVRKWAERLDRSIGSDEVSGRVRESLARAQR